MNFNLKAHLASLEKRICKQALKANEGSVTYSAKALGITFRQMRYLIKKYSLTPKRPGPRGVSDLSGLQGIQRLPRIEKRV